MKYQTSYKVYYEDTDAVGIMYHANYLKFAERCRTDMLTSLKIEQKSLMEKHDICFVVSQLNIKYIKPAKLGDLIAITCEVKELFNAYIHFQQDILCNDALLAVLVVKIACIKYSSLKPTRMPEEIKCYFKNVRQ